MHIMVKVKTGAGKEKIVQTGENEFEIAVRQPAERGLANKRVLELLRENLRESGSCRIKIVSGHRKASKILSVDSSD